MLRRFGHVLLIVALLGTTGTHWAMLQSVAWATMLADHAQSESLSAAISDTFDGKHPCPLCRQIAKNRNSEKKSDFQASATKLEFLNDATVFFVNSPTHFFVTTEPDASAPFRIQTPPVPPPRRLQG